MERNRGGGGGATLPPEGRLRFFNTIEIFLVMYCTPGGGAEESEVARRVRMFWRSLGPNSEAPVYGADTLGTLFAEDDDDSWNVGKLVSDGFISLPYVTNWYMRQILHRHTVHFVISRCQRQRERGACSFVCPDELCLHQRQSGGHRRCVARFTVGAPDGAFALRSCSTKQSALVLYTVRSSH